jgi:tetratricopeptide (TPR) repeat protein
MRIAPTFDDRYGLPITTNSTIAADLYFEGVDRLLSQNYGPDEKFVQAIEADEGLALAHGGLAVMLALQGDLTNAKESVAQAKLLAKGTTRREQQHVEAMSLFINGQGHQSLALIREHVAEFPRDMFMLRLASRLFLLGCSGAGVANFGPELLCLLRGVESSYGDDWAFLGQYSFAHHESGLLKEALGYGERSLELMPSNANASHSVAHVYFESGDPSGGREFLSGWLPTYDKRAPFHVHLSWHQALFELADCRYDRVHDLYEKDIRPSVQAISPISLADSASLMWRLQIYGGAPPPAQWDEVRDQAAPAADNAGPAFRDAHAALAFAASGDEIKLCRLTDRLQSLATNGDPLASEMTLPLAKAIGSFAEGNYVETVRLMEPIVPQLARIGGSHAQREVFEDTYLESCLRAEQYDKAEAVLTQRLKRRASVRDMVWLGRAQAHTGQTDEAAANFSNAREGWRDADSITPELTNLEQLTRSTG